MQFKRRNFAPLLASESQPSIDSEDTVTFNGFSVRHALWGLDVNIRLINAILFMSSDFYCYSRIPSNRETIICEEWSTCHMHVIIATVDMSFDGWVKPPSQFIAFMFKPDWSRWMDVLPLVDSVHRFAMSSIRKERLKFRVSGCSCYWICLATVVFHHQNEHYAHVCRAILSHQFSDCPSLIGIGGLSTCACS